MSRDADTFAGVVRNVRPAEGAAGGTFRLEEVDEAGNVVAYRVVQCPGLVGDVATDGDEVEVAGRVTSGGVVVARRIVNRRTGRRMELPAAVHGVLFGAFDRPYRAAAGCLGAMGLWLLLPLLLLAGLVAFLLLLTI